VRARARRDHQGVEVPDHVRKPVPALSVLPIVAALVDDLTALGAGLPEEVDVLAGRSSSDGRVAVLV
jgi:hypothetical protein